MGLTVRPASGFGFTSKEAVLKVFFIMNSSFGAAMVVKFMLRLPI